MVAFVIASYMQQLPIQQSNLFMELENSTIWLFTSEPLHTKAQVESSNHAIFKSLILGFDKLSSKSQTI